MKYNTPYDPAYGRCKDAMQNPDYVQIPDEHAPKFIFITNVQLGYFISSGKVIADLLNYKKIREVFSQDEVAKLIAYQETVFSNSGSGFLELRSSIRSNYGWELSISGEKEYSSSIEPLINALVAKETKEVEKRNIEFLLNISDVDLFKIKPMGINGYYLVVITESCQEALKIRDRQLALVSECLKVFFQYKNIDINAYSVYAGLYKIYLKLLKK